MDLDSATTWLAVVTALIGLLSGVGGIVAFGWKWILRAYRGVRFLHDLHAAFGNDPAHALVGSASRSAETEVVCRMLAAKLGIGVFVADPHGHYVWASEALEDIYGVGSGELAGLGWLQYVVENERQAVCESWEFAIVKQINYIAQYHIMQQCSSAVVLVHVVSHLTSSGARVGYAEIVAKEVG